MNEIECLTFIMRPDSKKAWYFLLQKGIFVRGRVGASVREFLAESLRYEDAFIESTVRVIFLNSSPVDDIDRVHIKEGDKLALGSSMPGLVGICMGRDNPYSSFRGDISENETEVDESGETVELPVKIFSTLAVDTGEFILKRGFTVDRHSLADFLEERMDMLIDVQGNRGVDVLPLLRSESGVVKIAVNFSG